jgi:hypothetical protein
VTEKEDWESDIPYRLDMIETTTKKSLIRLEKVISQMGKMEEENKTRTHNNSKPSSSNFFLPVSSGRW